MRERKPENHVSASPTDYCNVDTAKGEEEKTMWLAFSAAIERIVRAFIREWLVHLTAHLIHVTSVITPPLAACSYGSPIQPCEHC
jgi:hypothetical protein